MRHSLLAQRERFVSSPAYTPAAVALDRHLNTVLSELEPELLGVYWPQRGEFNVVDGLAVARFVAAGSAALPYAHRDPARMHYRAWRGGVPDATDECGIPASAAAQVLPDVVLVPCVGFTPQGHRLGYGGGYFDRWLAAHPGVTAVGVAWQIARVASGDFRAEGHDLPMSLVVTEDGVI